MQDITYGCISCIVCRKGNDYRIKYYLHDEGFRVKSLNNVVCLLLLYLWIFGLRLDIEI